MIAGRLHWKARDAKLAGRHNLAAFDFPDGSLVLTEAGTKHRASLFVFGTEKDLDTVDPGGIDVFSSDLKSFRAALTAENRTLKRAHRSPHPQWYRQCILRRDPARRATFANRSDA